MPGVPVLGPTRPHGRAGERWGGRTENLPHTALAAQARYAQGPLDAWFGDGSAYDGTCWPWLAEDSKLQRVTGYTCRINSASALGEYVDARSRRLTPASVH